MKLHCQNIIVTGASRGIGFAIAKKLAEEGARVVITGRSMERLEAACEKLPSTVIPMVLDARETRAFPDFARRAEDAMGGLDGLVNNAGACAYTREWGMACFEQTEEDWDLVMDTNVKAPYFLSRAVAKRMLDAGRAGNILNVVSEAAFVPATGSYGASKAALLSVTRGLAALLANRGIIVNGIAPGTTETDFVDIPRERAMHRQKNGRLATPEELADLAAFLMSEQAVNIIGQTILSCGGSTI